LKHRKHGLIAGTALAGVVMAGVLIGCATPAKEVAKADAIAVAPTAVATILESPGASVPLPVKGEPGMVAMRRVNESQYRQTIADLFGGDIEIAGRFEPDQRREGLLAIGSADLSISAGGIEQYISMARSISDQVLDDKRRAKFLSCKPADEKAADDACTAEFVRRHGRNLFRRSLTEPEVALRVDLAKAASTQVSNYNTGLKLAFVSLLTAPEFLFRVETAERDPAKPGQLRLDATTKVQRLSYLFWNSTPDEELLAAAASGDIHTEAGLKKQVDRLAASPRLERGVRAFFSDMMQFSRFENTTKDGATFPKYSFAIAEAAQEQTLRTIVDLLVTKNGDYREIFTTKDTFINRPLAAVYDVPFLSAQEWTAYRYPDNAEQAGIITQVAFLSMFSHPGRSSPTKRGVALQEVFMCRTMPLPADNVDFTLINDTNNGTLRTVRSRLNAHATNPTCSACHQLTDPLGLALERFDSIGQRRTIENGVKIDASSQLNGVPFDGATGLGKVMHANDDTPRCLVRNVFTYGAGRMPEGGEYAFVQNQNKAFSGNGYKLKPLLASIAASPEFFTVVFPKAPPAEGAPKSETAEITPIRQSGGVQ
jgi:hypothetical protein